MTALRDTIAQVFHRTFYVGELDQASEFRKEISNEVANAILVALRDFTPTDAMHNAHGLACPDGDGLFSTAEWRAMLQAAIDEV